MNDDTCPNCKSTNTFGSDPSYGIHMIEIPFECSDCRTTWQAEYKWTKNHSIETSEDCEKRIQSTPGIRIQGMTGAEFTNNILRRL